MLQRPWNTWSIQAKLLLSILVVMSITVVVSGVLFYLNSARTIERQTLSLTSSTVEQMTKNVDLFVTQIDRLSLTMYGDASVQRVLRASAANARAPRQQQDVDDITYRMLSLAASWQSIRGMYLFAEDGTLFYFARGDLPQARYGVASEPWYARMAQQAAPAVMLWPTGPETTVEQGAAPVFSHLRLIKNIDTGKKLGYLKIDISADVMRDLLAFSGNASRSAQVLLLTDEGQVIYSSGDLTGQRISDMQLATTPAQGQLSWRGTDYLYATQRSEFTHWTTVALIPVASLTIETQHTGALVLLLCFAAVLVLGLLLYMVTQRVTQPLRLMARTMTRVERGDLAVRLPANAAPDELGSLSRVFNTMLDSIERLITQVYEARLREKDAQLLALQTQINPHFLFNTLNSMRALSRRNQADTVAAMAESLAELFRYSMSNWNELVPLHEELAHVANYVTIQQARFGERLQFADEVPPGLLEAPLVKLSLQPLVENAIAHGLDQRRAGIRILVRADLQGEVLVVQVIDNGRGIDAATRERLNQQLEQASESAQLPTADVGIGMVNIARRIKLMFGDQYGVSVGNAPAGGTIVSLHLPYEYAALAAAREAQIDEYSGGRR